MEPLSALGVAAAAIQFADFATRLLSETVATYKSASGKTEKVESLESVTNDLNTLTRHVVEKAAGLPASPPPDSPDAVCVEACRECQSISQELAGILQELGAKPSFSLGGKSILSSLTAAIRAVAKESQVKALTAKLGTVQDRMKMAAMASLWENAQQHGQTLEDAASQLLEIQAKLDRLDTTAMETAVAIKDMARGVCPRDLGNILTSTSGQPLGHPGY